MQPSPSLPSLIDRWTAAGIITKEQADRIRADVATLPPRERGAGTSLVAEAIGYLGGVIVLVGLSLVVGWFWEDLPTAARIALAGGTAAALVAAGSFVPSRLGSAGARLRAVLWAGGSVAMFACFGLVAADTLNWDEDRVLLFAAGVTAVLSAVLWALHRRMPQHIVVFVAVLVAGSAATALVTQAYPWTGVTIWAIGLVWFGLSWARVLPSQVGAALGAIAAVIGALTVEGERWGAAFALATVAALVAAAVARRDLLVLGIASVGTLIVLPLAVDRYFPGVLPAALSLVGVGLLLVVLAVFVARRRKEAPAATGQPSA